MHNPIEFFFDFSSPYGYFASEQINTPASKHSRAVMWRPFLLGAMMKISERKPLASGTQVGDYSVHDFTRCAQYWGADRLEHLDQWLSKGG
ncbi:MAG: hypothetical protein GY889_06775 [Proteobacteria bacterium]|nr:hypothetical protein [Pseudomonadota bacterium]HJP05899.1 DsbA family protein [Arenicellales bacterium]|tara:strand:+ start:2913 stop:3185 length:273 start_codon:yes stop_codon:yes gene_type:complete